MNGRLPDDLDFDAATQGGQLPGSLDTEQGQFPQFDTPKSDTYRDVENSPVGYAIMYLALAVGMWYSYAALATHFGSQLEYIPAPPKSAADIERSHRERDSQIVSRTHFSNYSFICPACKKPMPGAKYTESGLIANCHRCGHVVNLRESIPAIIDSRTMQILKKATSTTAMLKEQR